MKIDKWLHIYSKGNDVLMEEVPKPDRLTFDHLNITRSVTSTYICPRCDEWFFIGGIPGERAYHYCPQCGVNMTKLKKKIGELRSENAGIDAYREMPTIEPERKKGKWIPADEMLGGAPYCCSECGEKTEETVMGKPKWWFCPTCGADMRQAEEGKDDGKAKVSNRRRNPDKPKI